MELLNNDYEFEEEPRVIPVKFVKNWCDKQLTPVAWARILLRLLPVVREYGHEFIEMKNPTLKTKCTKSLFHAFLATMQDIYGDITLTEFRLYLKLLKEKRQRSKTIQQ